MSKCLIKSAVLISLVALLALSSLAGCSTKKLEGEVYYPLFIPYQGIYAQGYGVVDITAKALIKYINEEDPIEGVTLKLLTYDTESTSEKASAGYIYLEGKGAEFVAVTDTEVIPTLKNTVDTDKFPMFMCSATEVAIAPPGYIFPTPMTFANQVQPLMQYIMDEWNYTTNPDGPKIGIYALPVEYGTDRQAGLEAFIAANPGKFADDTLVVSVAGGTDVSVAVNNLRDCDYIFSGATSQAMSPFIQSLKSDETNDSVFCFLGPDTGFMSTYAATEASRNNIDGTLWASDGGYYLTDDNEMAEFTKYLVDNYISDDDKAYITPAMATLVASMLVPIDALREAVKDLDDLDDLTGEMIYDAATSMTFDYDDFPMDNYQDGNRALLTSEMIYEYSATDNDWSPVSDWITAPAYAD